MRLRVPALLTPMLGALSLLAACSGSSPSDPLQADLQQMPMTPSCEQTPGLEHPWEQRDVGAFYVFDTAQLGAASGSLEETPSVERRLGNGTGARRSVTYESCP